MAISSVSKTVAFQDPVMETDLELLAKVNTYQQSKFDAGSQALQQEVDKWAMMTQIAKPELKAYANQKLVSLVNGINNQGGVNLSDINNVNSLKALGYNIAGDQVIMDGIETTMKMKALSADSQQKLSGKDGAKYDNTVAGYLMKGYQEWANDGDINNTKYDGPTSLPMGNMNTINEKVQKYLKDLKPDAESMPSGDLQKSYGYFQVDGKWLKGDRIKEAIDAVTDENDAIVFRAHGNSVLGRDTDVQLKSKLGAIYDNTSASIKSTINTLQTNYNNTSDAATKLEIQNMINQQKTALVENEKEKMQWYTKPTLQKEEREGIQESLYRNAWKSNLTNSYAYKQQKTEYKSNMPLIFHDRMQIQAQQWAKDYDLRVAEYELRKTKTEAEIGKLNMNIFGNGGGNLPLTQVPITDENNQQKSPEKFIDQFNSEYFQSNYKYYSYLYNILGSHDTKQRFENKNGEWIPKTAYSGQIDKEVRDLVLKLDNYANLTEAERTEVHKLLPTDPTELQALFQYKSKITSMKAFSKIAQDKESEIIDAAIAKGKIPFDWRGITVRVKDEKGTKDMPIQDLFALTSGPNAIYGDNVEVTGVPGTKYPEGFKLPGGKDFKSDGWFPDIPDIMTVKSLKSYVGKMREKAEKEYIQGGGSMFNSYKVPIPFETLSKPQKEILQKQLSTFVPAEDVGTINPIDGRIEYNFNTGKPVYKLTVQYKKGTKDKNKGPVEIDVTDAVVNSNGVGISQIFPKSDISHVWGLSLAKNGSTPFTSSDNYRDAIRTTVDNYPFQVSTIPNSLNGTVGARVKIAVPIGGGKTVEVNVKNFQDNSLVFPPDTEMIKNYLDVIFSTPEKKARFYKEHGLTIPQ